MWSVFFIFACTISISAPDPDSREAKIRAALQRINQLASEMEQTTLELESYTDHIRRTPNNNAEHLAVLQERLAHLKTQHALLDQEIKDWQMDLKAGTVSVP